MYFILKHTNLPNHTAANASDNKQRDKNMSSIRIYIDKVAGTIKVFNNGRGVPVTMHKDEKIMLPTLKFGHLPTSSNYDDDQKKVTCGRNGYGAKLCNMFSKKFVLMTSSKETKKCFTQVSSRRGGSGGLVVRAALF